MKKILLVLVLFSGCTTVETNKQIKILPGNEIMKDCENYKIPLSGDINELLNTILINKKIYIDCNNNNQYKKDFILKNLK